MGYAMFAARKIMLTDSIFRIQSQLMDIQFQRDELESAMMGIADGEIDAMDVASCRNAGLMISYDGELEASNAANKLSPEYQHGRANAEKEAYERIGASWGANIGGAALGAAAGAGSAVAIGAAIGTTLGPVGTLIGAGIGLIAGGFIGNKLSGKTQAREEYVQQYEQQAEATNTKEKVEQIERELAALENKLDKRQKTLDTKLQARQSELQQVETAEKDGIKNATPKYAGIAGQ